MTRKQRKRKPPKWDTWTAEREARRNKALIESGETFAAHKPSGYKVGGKRQEPRR